MSPTYCEKIEAAWTIVEHLRKAGYDVWIYVDDEPQCDIYDKTDIRIACGEADTAPMAICLAYLKLPS